MTTVYFVRHAQPNNKNHDDLQRELTQKGLEDRKLVTEYLCEKGIDVVLSSPFKRAVQTVAHFAEKNDLPILSVPDFRERKVESGWIEDFEDFCRRQWEDFSYKRFDGESLEEVQRRNVKALNKVLEDYPEKTIVIGSHGTALSTIINFYDPGFGYEEFQRIRKLMPWIVIFRFEGKNCMDIQEYDVFEKTTDKR